MGGVTGKFAGPMNVKGQEMSVYKRRQEMERNKDIIAVKLDKILVGVEEEHDKEGMGSVMRERKQGMMV